MTPCSSASIRIERKRHVHITLQADMGTAHSCEISTETYLDSQTSVLVRAVLLDLPTIKYVFN